MEIREITNKNEWEDFLLQCHEKTFLQSWNWGDFQKNQNNKIWRFGFFEKQELTGVVLIVKITAKRGGFLLISHAPVCRSLNKEILSSLLLKLKEIAKEEKVNFIRIAPLIGQDEENLKIFKDLGFRNAPMHASAYEATWKLDIKDSEDILLKNMRKTTRYLINKCLGNKDIQIEKSSNFADVKIYQDLNKKVAKRQKFIPFSDDFIKNEFEIFLNDGQAMLFFGKYKDQVVAGALVVFWQGIAFYHQAASLGEFAKFSVPYLLQWEAIKEAKKRGCVLYDFWGFTDPVKFPKHPWAGPTLFKMGFGGEKYEYVKTQDYIVSWKYWINYIVEIFRKFRRGL